MTNAGPQVGGARLVQTGPAILCMLASVILLTCNDTIVKSLSGHYPTGQLLFIRGLCVWPWIVGLAIWYGGLHTLKVKSFDGQILRSCCVIASAFLFVAGLKVLPLAETVAAAFTGPLFITALAPLMLGERVGWRRWLAVCIGFGGALVMIRPGTEALQLALLFPLASAFCAGLRDVITRRIAQTESPVAVLAVATAAVMLAGLATVPFAWVDLQPDHVWRFALSGAVIAPAQLLMIEAFRRGEAAVVAPFKYTSLIWALILGFLVFGDFPDAWTLTGAAIIMSAGLYVLHRETLHKRRKQEDPAANKVLDSNTLPLTNTNSSTNPPSS
ncbi:MAG: DMT family transporter [Pseudomonadota bacterium]